jgi:hypothetical protein
MSLKNGKKKKEKPRKKCENCGEIFEVTRPWKRYCSKLCQFEKWNETHPRIKID